MKFLSQIIIILVFFNIGICGNSYTSLGPFILGWSISEAKATGFQLKYKDSNDLLGTVQYQVLVDGQEFTLIFINGQLRTIFAKLKNPNFEDYTKGQKDFTKYFGRLPDVNSKPGVLPFYSTVWWHTEFGTNFTLTYNPQANIATIDLSIRFDYVE
jgi:hypothetical protein